MRIIPYLGLLTCKVALSSFQYDPTNASLGLPYFLNATGHDAGSNGGDWGAGYYGLASVYASISPGSGVPLQIAGSTINTFGIFDYDASLVNPAQYNPVVNSYSGSYVNQYNGVAYPGNMVLFRVGESFTNPVLSYGLMFPSVSFENIKQPVSPIDAINEYPPGGSNVLQSGVGLALYNGYSQMPVFSFCWGSGFYAGLYGVRGSSYVPAVITHNGKLKNVINCNYPPIANTVGQCINPGNGSVLFCSLGGVNSGGAAFNPDLLGVPPPYFYTGNVFLAFGDQMVVDQTILSDPSDNAAFVESGYPGLPQYRATMTPLGYFLLAVSGYPYYILINPDFSGYYRILLQPNSTAAGNAIANGGNASAGFGMDLNGNIWFGGDAAFIPLLYSTSGFNWTLTLSAFPYISCSGTACTLDNGLVSLALS
jgi:hypothetical protein